jgi:septal ring factor EnvC (AmiA/AmiB activator)
MDYSNVYKNTIFYFLLLGVFMIIIVLSQFDYRGKSIIEGFSENELRDKIDRVKEEINQLNNEINELRTYISNINDERNRLSETINKISSEATQIDDDNTRLDKEIKDLKAEYGV